MCMSFFSDISRKLLKLGFNIVSLDDSRPWGGYFVIDESQVEEFARHYFPDLELVTLKSSGKLSPKILIIKPGARLSWQYHQRRSEIWTVVQGPVGIVRSDTDEEPGLEVYESRSTIVFAKEERHRLVGRENWAIVAEFWQHTDPNHPSDEEDIVRVQDDYSRK
jgi:mannose-6-phosphate isomerase